MIDYALLHITDFERWLKDMQSQLDGKQSTRIFSSNVWLRDRLEEQLTTHLQPARKMLTELKNDATDMSIAMNLSASIKHCDDATKLVQHLISIHKLSPSDTLARNQWIQTLPSLLAHTSHLRNRLTIANNLLRNAREREKDDWLQNL